MNKFSKLFESAVGSIGRTGSADAKAHVGPELRNEFKKIVKKLGGKTVARQLLAEMNAGGPLGESDSQDAFQKWLAVYMKDNNISLKNNKTFDKELMQISKAYQTYLKSDMKEYFDVDSIQEAELKLSPSQAAFQKWLAVYMKDNGIDPKNISGKVLLQVSKAYQAYQKEK